MQKLINNPIIILSFLISISFVGIVVIPSYDDFISINDTKVQDSLSVVTVLRGGKGRPKNFDKNFHRLLQQGFPDWASRVEYQKNQEEFYRSAQNKLKMSPLGLSSSKDFFSREELNAIDYFQGKGFYEYHQKIVKKPNIFDTRESFLLKMHDKKDRTDFLNALNRLGL